MSKKVLVISSSPRKSGNSDLLCDEFIKGSLEVGHIVEKVYLKDKTIHYCNGCEKCFKEKGSCSQTDDMLEMKEKLIGADVIVLATPIYFYCMSSQMKTFIDRTCAFYPMITNKEIYYIVTAADEGEANAQRTIEAFRGFTICLPGAKEKGIIYGMGAWELGDIRGNKAMKEAYEMGKTV